MTHTEDLLFRLRDTASRGVSSWGDLQQEAADELQALMNAVAAEREACAKVCDDGINNATDWDSSAWDQAWENRAYAIRARGQA
jgi:hypothetical protein